MKTKFFTLFAAFALLFGAKAMAQTNGDVNEDGKVDEQDITAIIQIMQEAGGVAEQTKYYWYVGQEAVTANNYTTLAESSSTKYTTKNYTTTKFGKLYILTPDSVKSIKIKDVNAGVYVNESKYSQDNTFAVSGYKLWVTSAFGANAPQIIEYHY